MKVDRFDSYLKRRSIRQQAIDYKGGCCTICKYNTSLNALEFHHPNPLEKDFSISLKITSFEKIRNELDKCVLLCANCHREVHDGFHPKFLEDLESSKSQIDDCIFEGLF